MAQYSILTDKDLEDIVSQYNIGRINSYKILSGGSENTNYLLVTEKCKFVLTICEQKTLQKVTELAKLLVYLASHSFVTSKVIRTISDELIITWKDKPVMLKEYIAGNIIQDLPNHLLEYIGQELGALHQIDAPKYLPDKISYGKEHFNEVIANNSNDTFKNWLNDIHFYILENIPEGLPKALVHSDIFYDNIIVSDDGKKATIMDFEEASYYYRIFDLGMILIGLCSQGSAIDLKKVKPILDGYKQKNNLLTIELNSLKAFTVYAAAAIAFWRYKHFNFIQPDAKMYNHYLVMMNIADYVKELPDDCFQKLLLE